MFPRFPDHNVVVMEQIWGFLSIMGQVSAVLFGVMIASALALAAVSSVRRNRQLEDTT